jgi:preprotein translocase subunit SecF
MEFFGRRTHIDFLGIRRWSWGFSILLILASVLSFGVRGLNWGLDFTGGYEIQVSYPSAPNLFEIRTAIQNAGFVHSEVISFGSSKEIMIRLAPSKNAKKEVVNAQNAQADTQQQELTSQLHELLGPEAQMTSVNYVGPEVGAELAEKGLLAMVIALFATMLYIAVRFELKFALSAALALAHDPIVILGVFSLFQLRFDLTALAAVLAVIGYSLNDTVVVYDRIRENFRKLRKVSVAEVVNRAINDTLSRTVMTSGLTLLVVLVLFFLGGPSLHNFALALIIGVVVGTYSSIYVAGALAVAFGLNRSALVPQERKMDDSP